MASEGRAILRFTRMAPRKARLVVDLIRGRQVAEAFNILKFTPRSASRVVEKVLKSAVANAENLEIGDPDDLWVTRVYVDGGPVLKRFTARSMGRANPIKKRTSHITVVVAPKVSQVSRAATVPLKGRKPASTKEQKEQEENRGTKS
jgi:large subunit ribosomal protein L22